MYQQYRHMFSFNNKSIAIKLITGVHPGVGGGDQLETLGQESGGGTALSKTNKQSVAEATQQLHDDDEGRHSGRLPYAWGCTRTNIVSVYRVYVPRGCVPGVRSE